MKKAFWLLAISITIAQTACQTNKNLAMRFRNTRNAGLFANASTPQTFVQVDVNSSIIKDAVPAQLNFNVLSLSDKGQEAFINAANVQAPSNPAAFIGVINNNFNFSKDAKQNFKIIPKTIKKSIVFTVDRLQYQRDPATGATTFNLPGDRVSYLQLTMNIPNSNNAIFNSWDRYVTDHLTLNLGKVTSAQQWNASLNLSAKATGEATVGTSKSNEDFSSDRDLNTLTVINKAAAGDQTTVNTYELLNTGKGTDVTNTGAKAATELGGSANVGYQDRYETSLDLTSRILKLSGSLSESKMILRQEGGPTIDLSGNIVVSVELALTDDWAPPVPIFKCKEYYTAGLPKALNVLSIATFNLIFPDITSDIEGEFNYDFLYRQVRSGNRHLPEAKQKARYWFGSVAYNHNQATGGVRTVLVKASDIRPKVYELQLGGNTLRLRGRQLQFETIAEASTFLSYLNDLVDNSLSVAAITYTTAGVATALMPANVPTVTILTSQR